MSVPRLARPFRILVALVAGLAGLLVLAPAASASKPLCSWTKNHDTCVTSVTTQWATDTSAKVLISTDVKTTMRLDYQPAYYGGIKTVQDTVMSRDHTFTLTGLKPGWEQMLDAYGTAKDGTTGHKSYEFYTMHHKLTIRVDKVVIDNDGDNIGDGEVHAAMRLDSDLDDNWHGSVVFSPQSVHSGQELKPNLTFTYLDRPNPSVLHFGTVDLDSDGCASSWGDPHYMSSGSLSSTCGDSASAYATIQRTYDGIPRPLVMSQNAGGMAFHAYLTVTDSLSN